MRGGLTGTQVERDEENQTETPWMVTPSLAPSSTLLFLSEQMCCAVFSGWVGENSRKWCKLCLCTVTVGLGCFWLEFAKGDCTDIKLLNFFCVAWDSKQMFHLSGVLCQHFVTVHQSAPVPRPHELPSRQQSRGEMCSVNRYINSHSAEINKHVCSCEIHELSRMQMFLSSCWCTTRHGGRFCGET